MKLYVNLFKESGKWYAGDIVEVSEAHPWWSLEFRQEVRRNQNFMSETCRFADFYVVITHLQDYDVDPSSYFAQSLWAPGKFTV